MTTGARRRLRWGLVAALILFVWSMILVPAPAGAQDGDEATTETPAPGSKLFITSSDANSAPSIALQLYGIGPDGAPLDVTEEALVISHNGEPIGVTDEMRPVEVGTFTVFLIDATPGVDAQISTIQQVIEAYASASYMKEQVDALALYRVAETSAVQVLEPTGFYNGVRNFFSSPFEPQSGATALIDSLVGLLNEMGSLKPSPDMAASVVVFSDGTDAVSTEYTADQVAPRAAELGVPVHTIWLDNANLAAGKELGREYLAQVAEGSRGLAARLDQPDTTSAIWERITAFREQTLVRYTVASPAGGTVPVEVSLLYEPDARATTTVNISAGSPSVTLNVSEESRTLTLPDLEEPVRLSFSADVTWLDETERAVESASLLVNGEEVQEIPAGDLDGFSAEIGNLIFGANTVQVAVTDEQGLQAVSPEVILTVEEGERQIPEELEAGRTLLQTALLCLGGLLLLALVGGGAWYVYSSGLLTRRRRPRPGVDNVRVGQAPPEPAWQEPSQRVQAPAGGPGFAYLEVVAAESNLPTRLALEEEEITLGRSPALVNIAFEQDTTVSRQHATIMWDGHTYRIYDDESTSGTWVNDQPVEEYGTQLFDGDEIFMGKVHLRFRQR